MTHWIVKLLLHELWNNTNFSNVQYYKKSGQVKKYQICTAISVHIETLPETLPDTAASLFRLQVVKSLAPGRCGCNLELIIFKFISRIAIFSISCEIALWWVPQTYWWLVIIGSFNGLVPSHNQQNLPGAMLSHICVAIWVTRPQWVKITFQIVS